MKNVTQRGVIRVTQTSVLEVHTGGEGDGSGVGGGWWVDRVEFIGAVYSDQTSNSLISVHQCHPWIGNADTHST